MDGASDLSMEFEIAAEEPGLEFGVDAEQVVHDEDLAVAVAAGADADHGDLEGFGYFFGEGGRDLFEDDAGAAGFLKQVGVAFEFFGFRRFFCSGSWG